MDLEKASGLETAGNDRLPMLKSCLQGTSKKKCSAHFSDRVKQFRIVEYPSDPDAQPEEYDSSSDSSEGGVEINVVAGSRRSSSVSAGQLRDGAALLPRLIEELPDAQIRYHDEELEHEELEEELDYWSVEADELSWRKYATSHNVNTNRGHEYYYDYNSVSVPEELSGNEYEDMPRNLVEGLGGESSDGGLSRTTSSAKNLSGLFGVDFTPVEKPQMTGKRPVFSMQDEDSDDE